MRPGKWAVFALLFALLVTSTGCSRQPAASITQNVAVPDFTLQDLDGNSVSLSQFKGVRPVLVVFWATWCGYCMEEMPALIQLQKDMGDRLEVLAINVQESAIRVAPVAKAKGMNFKVLLDTEGEVSAAYGVVGVPTLVLIDKDGMGVAADNRLSEWLKQAIEKTVVPAASST